jgi:hypothetical protein
MKRSISDRFRYDLDRHRTKKLKYVQREITDYFKPIQKHRQTKIEEFFHGVIKKDVIISESLVDNFVLNAAIIVLADYYYAYDRKYFIRFVFDMMNLKKTLFKLIKEKFKLVIPQIKENLFGCFSSYFSVVKSCSKTGLWSKLCKSYGEMLGKEDEYNPYKSYPMSKIIANSV